MSDNVTQMEIDKYQSLYAWRDQIGVSETILRMCSVFKKVVYKHDCVYANGYYGCFDNYFTNIFNLPHNNRQCGPLCLFGFDKKETRINAHDAGYKYKNGDFFYHSRHYPNPTFLNHSCYNQYDYD